MPLPDVVRKFAKVVHDVPGLTEVSMTPDEYFEYEEYMRKYRPTVDPSTIFGMKINVNTTTAFNEGRERPPAIHMDKSRSVPLVVDPENPPPVGGLPPIPLSSLRELYRQYDQETDAYKLDWLRARIFDEGRRLVGR